MIWRRQQSFQWLISAMLLIAAGSLAVKAQTPKSKTANQTATVQMLDAATQAIKNEDYVKASILLKRITALEPTNVTAQTLAGIVADRENNLSKAVKHFALAARLSPKSAETRNNYGVILLRLKREPEAAREFSASLAINPNQPSALINLSQIKFTENTTASLREVKNLLNKANQIAPEAEILRGLVLVNLRLNEKAEAAANYQNYSALESHSSVAEQIALGLALSEKDLQKEAAQQLSLAIKSEPSNVIALTTLARIYLEQKDIKSAGRLLESAISNGITDARVYAGLADVYKAGGFYENAIPAMRLAIEADKSNQSYRFQYGLLLIDTKTPAAAIIRLKEAVAEFPRSAQLWFGLGAAQFSDSKLNDAQESLKKALELNPKLVPAIAYLAAISNVGGQSAEAASQYERALAIDEKNAILHYLLAETLLKDATADSQKIEKHLLRAVELDVQITGAHLDLGTLYMRQKRFAEAAAALEKTVRLDPNSAEAFYQLGQVYGRLKRADESRAALAKFKELSEREKTRTKTDYSELVRRLANIRF